MIQVQLMQHVAATCNTSQIWSEQGWGGEGKIRDLGNEDDQMPTTY